MAVGAAIRRHSLLHLCAEHAVWAKAVHGNAAWVVVSDQGEGAGTIDRDVDRPRPQRDGVTVLAQ
jgi:hypothetical protein